MLSPCFNLITTVPASAWATTPSESVFKPFFPDTQAICKRRSEHAVSVKLIHTLNGTPLRTRPSSFLLESRPSFYRGLKMADICHFLESWGRNLETEVTWQNRVVAVISLAFNHQFFPLLWLVLFEEHEWWARVEAQHWIVINWITPSLGSRKKS